MRAMTNTTTRFGAVALLALALGLAASSAQVQTSLSANVGQVGVPIQLQYAFSNVGEPRDMPRSIEVDGLDIRLSGTSRRVEIVNFQTTSSMVYVYTVVADRPGAFVIPAIPVQCGGKELRTEPAELRIGGPSRPAPAQAPAMPQPPPGPAPQAGPPPSSGGESARCYGEIVMGAKSAFVGEVVPVELRFFFRSDIQFDSLQPPSFGGDGFTAAPLSEPDQSRQMVGGVEYNVITFRSAITPVKSGQVEIPRAVMQGRMVVQGGGGTGDPFFDQFFRNFPVPGMGVHAENIEARTNLRKLDVLSLPKDGRPENFSGAVGQFTMSAKASQKSAGSGEPVTLALSVEGRGNFDAMSAPVLTKEQGWRTYAPKESFAAADSAGFGSSSGTKTFVYSMVAKEARDATPGAQFSYFDPREKKYVTLTTDPIPVAAAGTGADRPAAAGTAAPGAAQTPPPGREAGNTSAAPAEDLGALASALSPHAPGFDALVRRPWFLAANAALLAVVLLGFPVLVWWSRRARERAATAKLESSLRDAREALGAAATRGAFFSAAAQLVEAQLAVWDRGARPDLAAAVGRRVADPVVRRELESLLARRDELRYGGEGDGPLPDAERRRITELLQKFSSTHV